MRLKVVIHKAEEGGYFCRSTAACCSSAACRGI